MVPPIDPLFAPAQERGILAATLSMRVDEGSVDVGRVIEEVTARRPLARLPLLPVPTTRYGVQLLVDVSPAMDPFAADVEYLVEAARRVMGVHRVSTAAFQGAPLDNVLGPTGEPGPWRPPPPGTPVVLVSDLGIGGPLLGHERPTRKEWLSFAARARAAGCPVIALVPFAPPRWDRRLRRAIRIVHWDRRTTAGVVRRAIGPGHQRV
jgi:hypothetical protein